MVDILHPILAAAADAAAGANAASGLTGNLAATFPLAFAGAGAGIGVGLVGQGAAQAVGRNPGAFNSILVIAIIGMALSEAIAIYALIIAFTK
jgi:F-type H+-transporting ATPase subunit c